MSASRLWVFDGTWSRFHWLCKPCDLTSQTGQFGLHGIDLLGHLTSHFTQFGFDEINICGREIVLLRLPLVNPFVDCDFGVLESLGQITRRITLSDDSCQVDTHSEAFVTIGNNKRTLAATFGHSGLHTGFFNAFDAF